MTVTFLVVPIVRVLCLVLVLLCSTNSPVENQNDLELDFKVFFFVDSCC